MQKVDPLNVTTDTAGGACPQLLDDVCKLQTRPELMETGVVTLPPAGIAIVQPEQVVGRESHAEIAPQEAVRQGPHLGLRLGRHLVEVGALVAHHPQQVPQARVPAESYLPGHCSLHMNWSELLSSCGNCAGLMQAQQLPTTPQHIRRADARAAWTPKEGRQRREPDA